MRQYLSHMQAQPIKVAVSVALEEMLGDALNYAEAHDLDDDAVEREVVDAVSRWAAQLTEKHFPSSSDRSSNGHGR